MAGESVMFPALRSYLDWVKLALTEGKYRSLAHAIDGFQLYLQSQSGSSADNSKLREECSNLRKVCAVLINGMGAPPLSREVVESNGTCLLPLVFNSEDVAFPGAPHAKNFVMQDESRAALSVNSLRTNCSGRYFSILQYGVEMGLCAFMIDTLFFLSVAMVLILAIGSGSIGLSMGLLLLLVGLRHQARTIAAELPKARRVFSKFYALSLNPPWPIGSPGPLEKSGQSMKLREWVYQCLAHAPWTLRSAVLLIPLLVAGAFFGLPLSIQATCYLCLGAFVFGYAAMLVGKFRSAEGRFQEMERGLDEMFAKDYYTHWLCALRPQDRLYFTEILDLLGRLRTLGVPICELSAEGILGNALRHGNSPPHVGFI